MVRLPPVIRSGVTFQQNPLHFAPRDFVEVGGELQLLILVKIIFDAGGIQV
jgi:hypothetical protein